MARPGARLLLLLWGVLCAILGAAGLARSWDTLSTPCTLACRNPQLGPASGQGLAAAGIPLPVYAALSTGLSAAVGLAIFGLGILVALRTRHRRVPLVSGTLFATATASVLPVSTGTEPLDWASRLIGTLALAGMFWLFAAFPTLNVAPTWLKVPVVIGGMWGAALIWIDPLHKAVQFEKEPWAALEGLVFSTVILAIAIGQLMQYRSSAVPVRRQLRTVLAALSVLGFTGIAGTVTTAVSQEARAGTLTGAVFFHAGGVAAALVLASIAISLLRQRAMVAETALSAALTASIAAAGYAVLYAGAAATLSHLVGDGLPTVLSVFAASAGLCLGLPLVARGLSRQIHGVDDDPADLSASLGQILAAATVPAEVLPAMERALAARLRFPAVTIVQGEGRPGPNTASSGMVRVPLRGGTSNEKSAAFEVHCRAGQRHLTRRENNALRAAASPVFTAIAATRLSAALEESKASLAAVREDERKALRQELHDEVVPSLAIVRHLISAARGGGQNADLHLSRAEMTIDDAVDQLRSLARSLRPPALDDVGLEAAISQFAAGMKTAVIVKSTVTRPLAAIVELVAYRVAVEALLNAERHASASLIGVDLAANETGLDLAVIDDGVGIGEDTTFGVGLNGIYERTTEVGGVFRLQLGDPSGTCVRVHLPDRQAAP